VKLLSEIPAGTEVLLHICCAPDAAYGIRAMRERFDVTGFFYNPNIHPLEEFRRRLVATLDLQDKAPFPLVMGRGGDRAWEKAVRGLESEPEGGRRCEECIRLRLRETAAKAAALGMPAFGTVLTVSPRKNAAIINRLGREEETRSGVRFLAADLKKNDGYLRSVRITRELGIYRQRYCGCRYSIRPSRGESDGGSGRESNPPETFPPPDRI